MAKKKQITINNLKNLKLIKSASTIKKRDTILGITIWRLSRESSRIKKLLKKSNKLNK